jgi:hypothetical protein
MTQRALQYSASTALMSSLRIASSIHQDDD